MWDAIFAIAGLACLFCCCGVSCFGVGHYIFNEGVNNVKPETEIWVAQHYYDPQRRAVDSPSDSLFPSPLYENKMYNGNGVFQYPDVNSHGKINPSLDSTPGHVVDYNAPPKYDFSIRGGRMVWNGPEDVLQHVHVIKDRNHRTDNHKSIHSPC